MRVKEERRMEIKIKRLLAKGTTEPQWVDSLRSSMRRKPRYVIQEPVGRRSSKSAEGVRAERFAAQGSVILKDNDNDWGSALADPSDGSALDLPRPESVVRDVIPGCVNVIEEDEEINSFLVNCKGTDGTSPKIDMPEAPKVDAQVEEMNLTPGRSSVAEDTGDVAAETAEIAMAEALVEASLAEEETKDPEFRSFTEPLEDRGEDLGTDQNDAICRRLSSRSASEVPTDGTSRSFCGQQSVLQAAMEVCGRLSSRSTSEVPTDGTSRSFCAQQSALQAAMEVQQRLGLLDFDQDLEQMEDTPSSGSTIAACCAAELLMEVSKNL